MGQSVMGKDCVAVVIVKVTMWSQTSNMTISTIPTELLILLQPNLIGWCMIISLSVMCKDWIAVVKITVKV